MHSAAAICCGLASVRLSQSGVLSKRLKELSCRFWPVTLGRLIICTVFSGIEYPQNCGTFSKLMNLTDFFLLFATGCRPSLRYSLVNLQ